MSVIFKDNKSKNTMKQTMNIMFIVLLLQIITIAQINKQNKEQHKSSLNALPQEFKKVLEQWMIARETRNQEILEQLASDDYELTTADGKIFNRSQLFAESNLAEINLPSAPISKLKIEIKGGDARINFVAKNDSANKKLDDNELERIQKSVQAHWLVWENQIKRRADLMPNLWQATKVTGIDEDEFWGQAAQARSTLLNRVFDAPNNGSNKSTDQIKLVIEANNEFGKFIIKIINLSENYPQLRSNENFLKQIDELEGIGNRLAVAREDYFAAVRFLNKKLNQGDETITTNWKKVNEKWKLTVERVEK